MTELVLYDFYTKEAAKAFKVPEELVTKQQRNAIKSMLFVIVLLQCHLKKYTTK